MIKKRNYYTASKKSKIALAAIEGKLTQAQLRPLGRNGTANSLKTEN